MVGHSPSQEERMLFGPGEKDKEADTDGSRFEKKVDSLYEAEEEEGQDEDEDNDE